MYIKLEEREWKCASCNTKLDRDTNAGVNLRNYGIQILLGQGLPDAKPAESETNASII